MQESAAETKMLYLEMTQIAIHKGLYQKEWLSSHLLLWNRDIHPAEDYTPGEKGENIVNVLTETEVQNILVSDMLNFWVKIVKKTMSF